MNRLDCDVHHKCTGWWSIVWIHIIWFLCRYSISVQTYFLLRIPVGLMIGRVALLWVNRKVRQCRNALSARFKPPYLQIGERRALFIYSFLCIGLQLVVWLVPSLVVGAIAISIIGILQGPLYPIAMNHAGRILPRRLLTGVFSVTIYHHCSL